MIVTQVFEARARELLTSFGYPDVPVLVTPGPVVFRTQADIDERVERLIETIVESLCRPVQVKTGE